MDKKNDTLFGIRHKATGQYYSGAKGKRKHLSGNIKQITLYQSVGMATAAIRSGHGGFKAENFEIVEFELKEISTIDLRERLLDAKKEKEAKRLKAEAKRLEYECYLELLELDRLKKKYQNKNGKDYVL